MELYKRLQTASCLATTLVVLTIGGLVLVASEVLDLSTFQYHAPGGNVSERGYFSALNWSIGFLIFVPLFVYFALNALHSVNPVGDKLRQKGMLVDDGFSRYTNASSLLSSRLSRLLSSREKWALLVAVLGLLYSIYEWWIYSGAPILQRKTVSEHEIDWSVKALQDTSVSAATNATFSFMAFMQQALAIMALAYFAVFILAFADLVNSFGKQSPRLIPNIKSTDERLGFEIFEDVTVNILWASAFGYAVFYLSRLWNAYLHTDPPHPSILEFALPSLLTGFTRPNLKRLPAELFAVGEFGHSGAYVTLAALVLFALGFLIVAFVLRGAAKTAREHLRGFAEQMQEGDVFDGLPKDAVMDRLNSMAIWPIHYPRPNQLLVMASFAIISLVFFRIGLVYVGMLAYMTVSTVFERLSTNR